MGWWDDFANNIATDLGPLISLFGEAPTMQYLSETTMPEDIVIFAMAPIGVLTAVVSAIRVCGSPSLRAFIGRAQEGEGDAEVQLCSSTSRNVGELYNKGGVARIFGRPELLEIVHSPNLSDEDFYDTKDGTAGIHLPKEYFTHLGEGSDSDWIEMGKDRGEQISSKDEESQKYNKPNHEDLHRFAPSPNISLNVGIKPRKRFWFTMAAVVGIVLQSAVLAWAVVTRYYYHFSQSGSTADYAVPMTIIGTVFMCFGVGLCAHLVERSTEERIFERQTNSGDKSSPNSQLWWVQPGGQKLGDQVFDPFAYTETGEKRLLKYVTSWKKLEREKNMEKEKMLVFVAVGITMLGFVMQFLGLRACHSSVSVAQLLVMLVMSIIRAILRVERLKPGDNFLGSEPELYLGHELDWMALHMNNDDDAPQWHIVTSGYKGSREMSAVGFESEKTWDLRGPTREEMIGRIDWLKEAQNDGKDGPPHVAAKAFHYRNRLARLTSSWEDQLIPVRNTASSLARSIEDTANIIFNADLEFNNPSEMVQSTVLHWPIECLIPLENTKVRKIHLALRRNVVSETNFNKNVKSKWRADVFELQAILGLWLWSRAQLEKDSERIVQSRRILWPPSKTLDDDPAHFDNKREQSDFDIWMEAPQSSLWTETTQATPWLELNDKYHAGLCKSCPKLLKTATFGWQNVPSNCKESDVVLLQTTDSREKACAQEIYSMFLMSIIGVVKNIGGTTTSPKDHKHFHLANTNVSRIQEAFTKNNLGSVEEALACLIPVLRIQNKFPPLDGLDSDGQTLLHQAINRGESVSTISSLLEIGADVDVPNANGESPLFALANHRESKIATETTRNIGALLLLAHGDNPQRLNIQGESPLHRAAVKGNIVMAELLSKDADEYVLNQRKGETEGIYSIYSCNIPKGNAMRVHRNSRFTGESETRLGKPRMLETPLFLAIFHGHYEVAEILLENGADPRIPRLDGETALAKASESDNVQIIKLLIERGADVNSKALGSPLHRTAEFGRKDIAELLIKANAEMNARRENGATRTSRKFSETPLFLAVWFEKIDLVRLFLESGADPNIPREDGEKPLWTAVWRNREDMVQLLLEHGADVDSRGGWWETALSFAKREQRTNLVEILLKHGADSKLCMDEPPVWAAAYNKQLNVLEKLLRSGADPNVVGNRDGDTPIFQTVWGTTREPLTKLLLESGANPNHVNKFGMTTLHNIIRCWGGNTTWASGDMTGTVNLLLDWGLDPTIKNKNGETARNMAMKGNMTWAIGMLEHAERVWGEREEKEVAPGSQERGRKTEGQ